MISDNWMDDFDERFKKILSHNERVMVKIYIKYNVLNTLDSDEHSLNKSIDEFYKFKEERVQEELIKLGWI